MGREGSIAGSEIGGEGHDELKKNGRVDEEDLFDLN